MKYTDTLILETDYIISSVHSYFKTLWETTIEEGKGADAIFADLKSKLPNITMGDNSTINTGMYTEASVMKTLTGLGYQYMKPIGEKLHFFNKQTSISVYYNQTSKSIQLVP